MKQLFLFKKSLIKNKNLLKTAVFLRKLIPFENAQFYAFNI
jgi:hypothetical protein